MELRILPLLFLQRPYSIYFANFPPIYCLLLICIYISKSFLSLNENDTERNLLPRPGILLSLPLHHSSPFPVFTQLSALSLLVLPGLLIQCQCCCVWRVLLRLGLSHFLASHDTVGRGFLHLPGFPPPVLPMKSSHDFSVSLGVLCLLFVSPKFFSLNALSLSIISLHEDTTHVCLQHGRLTAETQIHIPLPMGHVHEDVCDSTYPKWNELSAPFVLLPSPKISKWHQHLRNCESSLKFLSSPSPTLNQSQILPPEFLASLQPPSFLVFFTDTVS